MKTTVKLQPDPMRARCRERSTSPRFAGPELIQAVGRRELMQQPEETRSPHTADALVAR